VNRTRAAWLTVAVLITLVAWLVLFLPARWAWPLLQARLRGLTLMQVHGLVWNGGAAAVYAADGRDLGRLRWRLSRSALWGRLDLDLALEGRDLQASGHLERDAQGRQAWRGVRARINPAAWAVHLPWGDPRGMLVLDLDRAVLQGNWPLELAGQLRWDAAAFSAPEGEVALGDLALDLSATGGVVLGRLRDLGSGPLAVDGQLQLSPLGWRFAATLQPHSGDPALQRWLARLGRPDAHGTIHLQRRGGLAAATPEPVR